METHRPFRFGTGCYGAQSQQEYRDLARHIEDLGYAILLTPDHFGDQLAPLIALMAAADATKTLRLGTYVCDNDFRHPAVLAKEAATLDLLSGGRFELGLGAGYMTSDYAQTGLSLDPPGVRVERLAEAVQIIKRFFAEESVTVAGTHYAVTALRGSPRPLQQPHPPLFLAGGGKRLLSLAAREADVVGLMMQSRGGAIDFMDGSMAATAQRVEWVRRAAGARFASLELNTLLFGVVVTDQPQHAAEQLAATWRTTVEQVLDSIHFLVGTVEHMVEQIQMWRERFGISYVAVPEDFRDTFAPVVARLAGT